MAGQETIILILFLLAAGYIGWRFWKSFDSRNGAGCAKGCGCAADKKLERNLPGLEDRVA